MSGYYPLSAGLDLERDDSSVVRLQHQIDFRRCRRRSSAVARSADPEKRIRPAATADKIDGLGLSVAA